MAHTILNPSVRLRLEMQLMNSNFWLRYGDKSDSSPVDAFIRMLTEGSSELDLILLRSLSPYLYGVHSHPLFHRENTYDINASDPQSTSELLRRLDSTILIKIFSFLHEEDLAFSVSRVCSLFRQAIVPRLLLDDLLGEALDTRVSTLLEHDGKSKRSHLPNILADRLIELSTTFQDCSVEYDLDTLLAIQQPSATDRALIRVFQTIPDCSQRLSQLGLGLVARTELKRDQGKLMAIITAIRMIRDPKTSAHRSLMRILGSALAHGLCIGDTQLVIRRECGESPGEKQQSALQQAFDFSDFYSLSALKSRFNRRFTADISVLLRCYSTTEEQVDFEAGVRQLDRALSILCGDASSTVFQTFDEVRSLLNKIKKIAVEASLAWLEDQGFYRRITRLFSLLEPICEALEQQLLIANREYVQFTFWLFPPRYGDISSKPSVAHSTNSELRELQRFISKIINLVKANDNPSDIREVAMSATALEASAVAKSASQRALFPKQSSSPIERSTEFISALDNVSRSLNKVHDIKALRETRMYQVTQEVATSRDNHNETRESLQSLLNFRVPDTNVVQSLHVTEEDVMRADMALQDDNTTTLPISLADDIRSRRLDEEESDDYTAQIEDTSTSQKITDNVNKEAEASLSDVIVTESIIIDKVNNGKLLKNIKLWNWTTFYTEGDSVWKDIRQGGYICPFHDQEEKDLRKLFSRGPEVAFTVGSAHHKLKHFTGEDFSGVRSQHERDSEVVDYRKTKQALALLPQVQAAGVVVGFPISDDSLGPEPQDSYHEDDDREEEYLILPLSRILELKREGRLSELNIKPHTLEMNLSEEEFEHAFRMNRASFKALPKWRQDKMKHIVGIF